MENSSKFEERVYAFDWPDNVKRNVANFYSDYKHAVQNHLPNAAVEKWFEEFLSLIKMHHDSPFIFQPYHEKVGDYYQLGVDFFDPLVDKKHSRVVGHENLKEIVSHLKKGHNVVFLANHQIEADPQALSILLDDKYPGLAGETIFVAGERVVTDPVAIPFSLGRNLLCIYSKRYIDHPPEKKGEKQHHNKKAMELMCGLLKEGGKSIYVAPSGGRDRRNAQGVVEVAKFDAQSVEMFYLMAQKAKTPTYFYPMALATYDLMPPPETIQIELGERRHSRRTPIHLAVGSAIDMERFPGYDQPSKHEKREARADYIWNLVCEDYKKLGNL